MYRAILLIAALPALSGCAAFSAYTFRPTNYEAMPGLKRGDISPPMATLSLDASRRLMIYQLEPYKFTCSEPPPDAAVSLLAKAALEASAKPQAGGEATASYNDEFQANAAAIAKRTATVEFWRTTSFSYCLLLMNRLPDQAKSYLETAERIAPYFGGDDKPAGPAQVAGGGSDEQ